MKVSAAKQVHYESGPNMTPLVDVVMVILIFLMLAGSFGTGEKYMVTQAAMKDQGVMSDKVADPNVIPPALVNVIVNREGGVLLESETKAITNDAELVVRFGQLLDKLQQPP